MNIWNLSGEVLRHGIKGSKYPKLWVHVGTSSPTGSGINDNKFFVNFDLDTNLQSANGKVGEFVKNKLQTAKFVFISEAMVADIQKSVKDSDGNWTNEYVTGVKAKIKNIKLSDERYPVLNDGIAKGAVSKYYYDPASKIEKFIVEDRYRNVKTNEFKTRDIPVMRQGVENPEDLSGKYVFVKGTLCGTTLTGESKTFIWANLLIKT